MLSAIRNPEIDLHLYLPHWLGGSLRNPESGIPEPYQKRSIHEILKPCERQSRIRNFGISEIQADRQSWASHGRRCFTWPSRCDRHRLITQDALRSADMRRPFSSHHQRTAAAVSKSRSAAYPAAVSRLLAGLATGRIALLRDGRVEDRRPLQSHAHVGLAKFRIPDSELADCGLRRLWSKSQFLLEFPEGDTSWRLKFRRVCVECVWSSQILALSSGSAEAESDRPITPNSCWISDLPKLHKTRNLK